MNARDLLQAGINEAGPCGWYNPGPVSALLAAPSIVELLRRADEADRLREALERVEWYEAYSNSYPSCPCCGAMEHEGHFKGCALRAALAAQPAYPTAWAYEQACRALDGHRARADAAEAEVAGLREALGSLLDNAETVYVGGNDVEGWTVQAMLNADMHAAHAALAAQPAAPEAEPERSDESDDMCPNCQTPWKCNGPHLSDQTPYAIRDALEPAAARCAFDGCGWAPRHPYHAPCPDKHDRDICHPYRAPR